MLYKEIMDSLVIYGLCVYRVENRRSLIFLLGIVSGEAVKEIISIEYCLGKLNYTLGRGRYNGKTRFKNRGYSCDLVG